MQKFNYDKKIYDFRGKIENIFGDNSLEDLFDENITSVLERKQDQNTRYHKLFYDWSRTLEFKGIYDRFIESEIKPIYGGVIVYQTIPTFRIAFRDNIAVGEFHKDKNYRDQQWAEIVKEDNFFVPITNAFDTNTIWVESQEDKADFSPMDCEYGSFIKWDGSNLTHGNKINKTGQVRVSFDFRVIKMENYKPSTHGSINMNSKFQIGGYYSSM